MGKETTAGTIAVATTVLRANGMLEDLSELDELGKQENVGLMVETDRTNIKKLLGGFTQEDFSATFEQFPYLCEASIKKVGTGVTDTAGSGKIYNYPVGILASNTIQTYTIEGGDANAAEVMEYAFVESWKLSGESEGGVIMGATWKGRQVVPQAFTGTVAIPTVEDIVFGQTKLYIDAITGTAGTTPKSNTMLGFSVEYKSGLIPKYTGEGNKYFTYLQNVGPEMTINVTFEHDGIAVAQKAAFAAQTPLKLRLLLEGSTLTTAGTFSKKSIIIDATGKWTKFDKIGERNGNDIVTGTFVAKYNPTAASFATVKVVNQLATLT
jgi:hypothetical protein